MNEKYSSSLSTKRILISLFLFLMIPMLEWIANRWVDNTTLSYTFALNVCSAILIIYDWNLFGIHYNRSKLNIGSTVLYTLLGILCISLWIWFGRSFLNCFFLVPDASSMHEYAFAIPAILIAYSYMLSSTVNISFKCLTDHIDVRSNELLIILICGFLFGFLFTAAFTPLEIGLWIRTYFFNTVLIMFLSYLYNQSGTFFPGILSMGTVILAYILLFIL